MSKTYKNGLFKKKNPYKSPKISIFEKSIQKRIFKKIRTCTDKSVRVGTLSVQWHTSDIMFCGLHRK